MEGWIYDHHIAFNDLVDFLSGSNWLNDCSETFFVKRKKLRKSREEAIVALQKPAEARSTKAFRLQERVRRASFRSRFLLVLHGIPKYR
jgi:hypothetical protein